MNRWKVELLIGGTTVVAYVRAHSVKKIAHNQVAAFTPEMGVIGPRVIIEFPGEVKDITMQLSGETFVVDMKGEE